MMYNYVSRDLKLCLFRHTMRVDMQWIIDA